MAASWRGEDATGIALCPILRLDQSPVVFKKAMCASDFIKLETYNRLINNLDLYGYVLGHARSSTTDRWSYVDQNAHPFTYGGVTLTHNGHVNNVNRLDTGLTHPVDSAHVAAALSKVEPDLATDVLSKLDGGYALVWHDTRDSSLNFARNTSRPLVWCYVEKENTMYWASELEALWAILYRNNIALEGKFKFCTAHKHFKFDIKDLRTFKSIPFQFRQSHLNPTLTGSPGAPWRGETRRLPLPGISPPTNVEGGSNIIKNPAGQPSAETTTNDGYTPPAGSLRPKSRRKLRQVDERLLRFGFKIDGLYCFIPEEFYAYKNQRGMYGSIRGHSKFARAIQFEIGNISRELWTKVLPLGKIYGRIANIKNGEAGQPVVMCDYDKENTDRFVFRTTDNPPPRSGGAGTQKHFPSGPSALDISKEETSPRIFRGPSNTLLSKEEFERRVQSGCAFCSTPISTDQHEHVLWVGQDSQPMGICCRNNPKVLEHCGITVTL